MRIAPQQLAEDLVQIQPGPDDCVCMARCLLDLTAAVLAGASTPIGQAVVQRYLPEGDRGFAFTLAYLAEIAEFSHGYNPGGGHVGSTPLPTVLALAARRDDLCVGWTAAALAGYEAFARVGHSFLLALEHWGSNASGFAGSLGAAAAMARVLDMDTPAMSSALGMAAYLTPFTPIEGFHLSGGHPAAVAAATTTGMYATELVSLGSDGSQRLLDDLHLRVVGRLPDPGFIEDSESCLAAHNLYFKPYPCCRFTHGAIQAVLELGEDGISHADIEQIVVQTTPRATQICGQLPEGPRPNYLERQFSIPYLVGLAALQSRVAVKDVLAPTLELDDRVIDFARQHVVVEAHADLVEYGNICPAVLQVRLSDGGTVKRRVTSPWGCPDAPMTEVDIRAKFHGVALPLLGLVTAESWEELALDLAWTELSGRVWDYLMNGSGVRV